MTCNCKKEIEVSLLNKHKDETQRFSDMNIDLYDYRYDDDGKLINDTDMEMGYWIRGKIIYPSGFIRFKQIHGTVEMTHCPFCGILIKEKTDLPTPDGSLRE